MSQRYFKFMVLLMLLQIKMAAAQQTYRMNWIPDSASRAIFMKLVKPEELRYDSVQVILKVGNVIRQLTYQSYLTANIDSVFFHDSVCDIYITPGPSYSWVTLKKGNATGDVLSASGWREELFNGKPFSYVYYAQRVDRMLGYLEQNGYPFAQIRLDSIIIDGNTISGALNVDRGDLIVFDTLEIIGDANVKGWFLSRYMGIRKDAPYNELLIRDAGSRLSQLPFLQTTRPVMIYFVGTVAKPVVYGTNRRSSSIDGIIGFAPSSTNNNNKLLITGEANLKLQNLFGTGKSFDLAFRSFLSGSQELKTRIVWPYIFRSSVGLDYELNVLKFDSSFLDVKHDLGLQYRLLGNDYIKVFYSLQTTSLITVDTLQVKLSRALPVANDLRNDLYGLALKLTRYDYFLNPRKGYALETSLAAGRKKIGRNPTVDGIRFQQMDGSFKSIYDTMDLSSLQYRFTFRGDLFIPVTQRLIARLEGLAGHVETRNLFFSELFRIGGIRTLKGFDEQSIFASSYGIVNTEIRYLLQQNSNVMLFWNGAWYTNEVRQPALSDRPFGFGAGLNFETGAGIFSLYYAVGKQFNNPVEFNKAKIHFGFANYF